VRGRLRFLCSFPEEFGGECQEWLDVAVDLVVLRQVSTMAKRQGTLPRQDRIVGLLYTPKPLTSSTILTWLRLQNCHHSSKPFGGARSYLRVYSATAWGKVFDWLSTGQR
jgi:hypothetical protein